MAVLLHVAVLVGLPLLTLAAIVLAPRRPAQVLLAGILAVGVASSGAMVGMHHCLAGNPFLQWNW